MREGTQRLVEGSVVGDHFIIRRKLGGGGMGEVFLAENLNVSDKKYAVKVLHREFSDDERFASLLRDEAVKQARLEHDNVVGMYDFFAWEGHFCLVQTFVKGRTVGDMLMETPNGLEVELVLELMQGILAGLDYAHQNGILHCDVKPANVIVDPDGRPHVTDFGISRDIGSGAGLLGGAGTVEYMSPEQIEPPYDIDHRTDVFSSGVLMFQMLSGRMPFKVHPGQEGSARTQLNSDAPDVRTVRPDVPEGVARIVATALHRDRAQRFQGCAEFAQEIANFRARQRWRRTWLPALIVIGVAAIGGAIGLYQWRQHVDAQVAQRELENAARAQALEAQRQVVIGEALHNAAAAMNQMCFEAERYVAAQGHLELARQNFKDDAAAAATILPQFEQKLSALLESARKHASVYAEAMQRLGQQENAHVTAGMGKLQTSDPMVAAFAGPIQADYAAKHGGKELPSLDDMLARCAATKGTAASQ